MKHIPNRLETGLESFIFWSRWIQVPLYLGLIVAQCAYVWSFLKELWHLVHDVNAMGETQIMLIVLGLIDVVMLSNLIIMVVIGGYETFVSKLDLGTHEDVPEWLSHVNAGVLKVKLATALISISGIHLLKGFINADAIKVETLASQTAIHLVFLLTAIGLAWVDRLMTPARSH
ncbi:TIGR00645 family protein [Leeia oryzae]|uniref:TIGR00645 family protein n=1 Tax=Leeia oryzae TaxID=356662 RepID=UPI00039A2B60|nr:TIGR00645 family protein [Leeia oryzae]